MAKKHQNEAREEHFQVDCFIQASDIGTIQEIEPYGPETLCPFCTLNPRPYGAD